MKMFRYRKKFLPSLITHKLVINYSTIAFRIFSYAQLIFFVKYDFFQVDPVDPFFICRVQ